MYEKGIQEVRGKERVNEFGGNKEQRDVRVSESEIDANKEQRGVRDSESEIDANKNKDM